MALGAAQRALVLARHRAGSRFVGGRPLIERQSTGHRLARGSARIAVARATILAAGRDEDAGIAADYRAPASAAAAAEAAFACAQALVQVYGAAGTSDPAATAAFEACQSAGSAAGPAPRLWLQAGRRRGTDLPGARTGAIDSCVAWLRLQCAPDQKFLDSLVTVTNWMPVLIPFDIDRPIPVRPGDVLDLDITRRLHDGVHPRWSFAGAVRHTDGSLTPVRADSPYADGPFRASWLHRALFREGAGGGTDR